MLKRFLSLVICLTVIFGSFVFAENAGENAIAADIDFGDRILYGGTAVDIGSDTVYSENGSLFKIGANGEKKIIAEIDAKYLNYFDSLLWFVSGNNIYICNSDGSGLENIHSFGEEIKCLYVLKNGMLYLRGNTVCSMQNGIERKLLTREGICGFVPEKDGSIRWITKNPDYVYEPFNGDEIWNDGNDEYLQYISSPNSDSDDDKIADGKVYSDYGTAVASNSDYSGPYVQVGNVTLPLANHMPGTYFSKNGKACTCHHTSSTYCIQSVGNCNCMRYYPTGVKETCKVDLLGAQCFSFARMVFWTCFGFTDHSANQSLYYNVGTLSSGAVTANSIKALLMKAAPGAHVRLAAGHSVSILTMDEDFIVIYHGNAGGDGVVSSPCVVSTRRYTWEQFATAAAKGILFVNMPVNYPDSKLILTEKEAGFYKINANLNLRANASTESASLTVIPNGTVTEITEIDGFWGKTEFNGNSGWVFLEYTTFMSRTVIAPSSDVFKIEDGYLRAKEWKMTLDSFSEHFDKQSITVTAPDGSDITSEEYIGTGCVVTLSVNGEILDTATVCIAGDINGNGVLDVGDYILAKRIYMNAYNPTDIQKEAADVSEREGIDVYDYILVKRFFFNPNPDLFTF